MAEEKKAVSKENEEVKVGWRESLTYTFNNITVEPMLACYIIPSVLAMLATQNLNLEKACYVNLGYEEHVCKALTARKTANYTVEETKVQQLVANMNIWKNILQSAVPSAMMLFLGAWSDRHRRRKPLMLMPIIGEFLTSVSLIVCTFFFFELPMEVAGFAEAFFPAFTGGWFTMFMAVFSYIGDVTTLEMRTLRIGVVKVFVSVGIPIGVSLSGYLFQKIGFYGIFSIAAVMYVVSFVYGLARIKEVREPDTKEMKKVESDTRACASVRDFLDWRQISETFRVTFQNGASNRRKKVVMLMISCMVIIGPMHGELAVMYLFMRYRFNWDEMQYSMFSTYSMLTNLCGTMITICVFSHKFKMDDAMIGVLSCTSKILSSFVYAFATTPWVIYLAPIVEILNGTSFIAMRSIITKLVPSEELGKVNSLFGVCEALMPLVYGPMYSGLYAHTMTTVPGAFFLLGGALTLPAVFMFLWMYSVHKKEEQEALEKKRQNAGTMNMAFDKTGEENV